MRILDTNARMGYSTLDPVGLVEFSAMPRFRASGRLPRSLGDWVKIRGWRYGTGTFW
jgi:hypothetical protein